MIAVCRKFDGKIHVIGEKRDIIILKDIEKQEIDEQGRKIIYTTRKKVNLTKLVNETAKIAKQRAITTAEAKLEELQKVLNK